MNPSALQLSNQSVQHVGRQEGCFSRCGAACPPGALRLCSITVRVPKPGSSSRFLCQTERAAVQQEFCGCCRACARPIRWKGICEDGMVHCPACQRPNILLDGSRENYALIQKAPPNGADICARSSLLNYDSTVQNERMPMSASCEWRSLASNEGVNPKAFHYVLVSGHWSSR